MPTRLTGFQRSLFSPGERVCCALSGGADSTALLLAVLEANQERDSLGAVVTAVHVHHGLREAEADEDAAFVTELCKRYSVPIQVLAVDTPGRQEETGEGLEEAARTLRYDAFRRLLGSGSIDSIATGHTRDDQAETVLMKLLRGAWTEGLGGISPVLQPEEGGRADAVAASPKSTVPRTGRIVRPLLQCGRADIERFLRSRNQPWRNDSSNADRRLTRNLLRHEILPLLRELNPRLDETLARTAALAREEESYWKSEVARLLPALVLPGKPVRGGGRAVSTAAGERSVAIEVERLRSLPLALSRRVLRAAAMTLGSRPGAEDSERLLALAGLADLPGLAPRNGTRLDLGGGLRAERSLREIRLSRSASDIPKKV